MLSAEIIKVSTREELVNKVKQLEQAVYDATRSMFNAPSSHIKIMGFGPADSDVVVKHGVNFWTSEENIFA